MHRNEANCITISPAACVLGAFILLVLPLNWVLSALIAAVFHEFCHYLAIKICGGYVFRIRISAGGIIMEFEQLSCGKECICALAGPLGSLLLLLFIRWLPLIGLCAVVQGLFNLIPIYPMDGGRALRCCLMLLTPNQAEAILQGVEWITITALCTGSCYVAMRLQLGPAPLMAAIMLTFKILSRKRPCKERRLGVQ